MAARMGQLPHTAIAPRKAANRKNAKTRQCLKITPHGSSSPLEINELTAFRQTLSSQSCSPRNLNKHLGKHETFFGRKCEIRGLEEEVLDGVIQQTLAHEIHALESSLDLLQCNYFTSFGFL